MSIKEYVKKAKDKKTELGEIMQMRTDKKVEELKQLELDAEIVKAKREIQQPGSTGVTQQQAQNWMGSLFVGRSPEDVQKILDGLTPEKVQTLAAVTSAMNNNQTGSLMQLLNRPDTSKKEIYNLFELMLKLNPPQQQRIDLKGIAALMKEMRETSKPQQASQFDPMKYMKDFYEMMTQKDQQLHAQQLEMNKQPPLTEQLAHYKSVAEALGMGNTGKTSELDLKIAEMNQSREIDLEKIRWEQKKFYLEKEADSDKWTQITGVLSPILQMNAPAIQQAVRSVAKDVSKSIASNPNPTQPSNPNPNPNPASSNPQPALFTCPKCQSELTVPIPPNAPPVIPVKCPKCQTVSPAQLGTPEQTTPQTNPQNQPHPPQEESPPTRRGLRTTYT